VFAQYGNEILVGNNPDLDITESENNLNLKREADEQIVHRMAKVDNFVGMCQSSQDLHPA